MYGQHEPRQTEHVVMPGALQCETTVTPEMLAMWSAQTDSRRDYIAPKAPI